MRTFGGRLLAVAVAVVSGVTASVVESGVATADPVGDEGSFVAKLNEFRGARGLRPLAVRADLQEVARSWSRVMLGRNDIAHNPDLAVQAPGDWDRLGENVGVGVTVQDIHDAFVASPTHLRQMVDDRFDSVGVGVLAAPDGTIFVTVDFMTTRSVAIPPPASAPPATPASASARTSSPPPAAATATPACRRTRRSRSCTRPARRARSGRSIRSSIGRRS